MEINEITYQIRGAAFRVHTTLGPGLLESVYEAAMKYELGKRGLKVQNQVGIPMIYEEIKLDLGFRSASGGNKHPKGTISAALSGKN